VVEVLVVLAAVLEAALTTVAPIAPPAMDPATSSAITPRRLRCIGVLLSVVCTCRSVTRTPKRGV
jgi:hypothetical protein